MAVDTPTRITVEDGWEVLVDLPGNGLHGITLAHDGAGTVTLLSDGAATVDLDSSGAHGITMED